MRALMLLMLAVVPFEAQACIESPEAIIVHDPIAALDRADSVFYATVRRWTQTEQWMALAEIEVHEVWKGHGSPVLFHDLGSTCSRSLEEGKTYLIYATLRSDGQLEVSGSIVPADRAAEVIEKLRRHTQGTSAVPDAEQPVAADREGQSASIQLSVPGR